NSFSSSRNSSPGCIGGSLFLAISVFLSVMIDDLNVPRGTVLPDEANQMLIVHANTVLSSPVSGQGFQQARLGRKHRMKALAPFLESFKGVLPLPVRTTPRR